MDLLKGRIRPLYFRYLSAAFGSALISSIYGIVDMAMVGQYQGPQGTAAMAVISPIWNIIYSLGLLMGIGGSILLSTLRGESEENLKKSNEYFTAAVIGVSILALITWIALIFFDRELLLLFGAEESLMPLARRYVLPVKFAVPLFLFSQLLSAFLRNDSNPGLATRAVLCGGVFNVFGDYILVFVLDLGILGAGMATCLGCLLTVCVMLTHFFKPGCTLRFVRPTRLVHKLGRIILTGFSTFFIDVAMGILTVLFNRQILTELAEKADCVIVGRCADWFPRAYRPFRIFVYADMEHKLLRCRQKGSEHEHLSDWELRQHIQQVDRHRASYYRHCTDRKWGDKANYDLCINTGTDSVKEIAHHPARYLMAWH